MERVKSDVAAAEEKAAAIEAQQTKGLEELENQFRQEVETLQEYIKSQEKEFVAEIERTKVGLSIYRSYFACVWAGKIFSENTIKKI